MLPNRSLAASFEMMAVAELDANVRSGRARFCRSHRRERKHVF